MNTMSTVMKQIQIIQDFCKKTLLLAIVLGPLMGSQAIGWSSHLESEKPYNFKFRMQGQVFEYQQVAASYEEAYERAAKACYKHFKGGRHLSEDRGLDIIDVCANPRSS